VRPDVLTLDLSMPGMNGLEVLAELGRRRDPTRVVVVSSFSPTLVERALDVLDAGATDLVTKPRTGESIDSFVDRVAHAVRAASAAGAQPASSEPRGVPASGPAVPRTTRTQQRERVLVIASSTGGPRALGTLIPLLGASVGGGCVIVQHMPPGFTTALARRLDDTSPLTVAEATAGAAIAPGTALIAPAGLHLRLDAAGRAWFDDQPAIGGVRPRADLTICDLVERHGSGVVLVVLTGMGSDGLEGARAVRAAGGIVLAQAEEDCVVYGMPRHVVEHDLADATGSIDELGVLIGRALATDVAHARRP
jgi:two-component system chemotaxis response regulator CheB